VIVSAFFFKKKKCVTVSVTVSKKHLWFRLCFVGNTNTSTVFLVENQMKVEVEHMLNIYFPGGT